MKNFDLQIIANDICAAANSKFAAMSIYLDYKWILIDAKDNGKRMQLIPIEVADNAILSTIFALNDYPAYIKFREYIGKIDCVQNIISIDQEFYLIQPEQILTKLMRASFSTSERSFNSLRLLAELEKLTAIIGSGLHEITLVARLHGLNLEIDLIEIEPNISLAHLDNEAINQRQPKVTEHSHAIRDYSDSNVEVRIKKECLIATHDKTFWQVHQEVVSELELKLENVIKSIKLYHHGRFQAHPISHHSSLFGDLGSHMPLEPMFISEKATLNRNDINGLKQAFSIVKSISQDKDNVLDRSFSRFLIGLDERIPEEQLVDFVIAWESLLQTVNGQSNKVELIYRFSLNGAAILCAVDNVREFTTTQTFMKTTYDIRSTIVHGGKSDSLKREMKKIDFNNLVDLNKELAKLYRQVILWLSILEKEERPYHKKFGWELLVRLPIK